MTQEEGLTECHAVSHLPIPYRDFSLPIREHSVVDSDPSPAGVTSTAKPTKLRARVVCVMTILAILTLCLYLSIPSRYPFYFMWDMDQWVVTESLTINSDAVPLVVLHPGFGTLFLNHFTHGIAYTFGLVALNDMGTLEQSLNPMLALAELATFFRFHTPVLAFGIVFCLWTSLLVLFRPGAGWAVLLWLVLAAQSSLLYHSAMIRGELYAIFYWSAALLLAACAITSNRRHVPFLLFFLAGILLGLSWLAKVQAILYLSALPFFVGAATGLSSRAQQNIARLQQGVNPRALQALAVSTLAGFVMLLAAAHAFEVPAGTFGPYYNLSLRKPGLGLLISAFAFAGYFCIPASKRPQNQTLFLFTFMGTTLLSGFLSAFLLHFILYADLSIGLDYLLQDAKAVFWWLAWDQFKGLDQYVTTFVHYVRYHPGLFATFLLSVALTLTFLWREAKPGRLLTMFCILALCAIVVLNTAVGVRFVLRDLLWIETITVFLSLMFLTWMFQSRVGAGRFRRILSCALAALLLVYSAFHSSRMLDRVDAGYNVFGWQSRAWTGVWFNPEEYTDFMTQRLESTLTEVFPQATRHADMKRLTRFVFKNQKIDLRHVGVAAKGMPVFASDTEWRISSVPKRLAGAVIVDSAGSPVRDRVFFDKTFRHHKYLDKIVAPPSRRVGEAAVESLPNERWLSILGRPDLEIYLFVTEADIPNVRTLGAPLKSSILRIHLTKEDRTIRFVGAPIRRHNEIDVGGLQSPYFFAIKELPLGTTPKGLLLPAD